METGSALSVGNMVFEHALSRDTFSALNSDGKTVQVRVSALNMDDVARTTKRGKSRAGAGYRLRLYTRVADWPRRAGKNLRDVGLGCEEEQRTVPSLSIHV